MTSRQIIDNTDQLLMSPEPIILIEKCRWANKLIIHEIRDRDARGSMLTSGNIDVDASANDAQLFSRIKISGVGTKDSCRSVLQTITKHNRQNHNKDIHIYIYLSSNKIQTIQNKNQTTMNNRNIQIDK